MKLKILSTAAALFLVACGGGEPPAQPAAPAQGNAGSQGPTAQAPRQAAAPQAPAEQRPQSTPRAQVAAGGNSSRFQAGTHYQPLSPPQPTSSDSDQVEVADVFMYGCPACFAFEPHMTQWKNRKADYVNVVQIPAMFDRLARLHAQAFYTAEALGKVDEMHTAFFREIHVNNNRLDSEGALAQFFGRFGVDEETFKSTFDSFAVHTKMQRADELVRRYRVSGTPTVVVNGTYVTTGPMAGSYETWFDIIDDRAAAAHAESGG